MPCLHNKGITFEQKSQQNVIEICYFLLKCLLYASSDNCYAIFFIGLIEEVFPWNQWSCVSNIKQKTDFSSFVKFICKNNYSSFQGSLFKQTVSYRCFTGKSYWKFPWQHSQGSLVFVKLKLHQNLKSFRKSAEHLFLSSYLAVSFFVLKLLLKSTWKKPGVMHVRDHSFSTFAQYSEKLTILTPWYELVRSVSGGKKC